MNNLKQRAYFDDNSLMPFGKHRGVKLANVPSDYLLWFWNDNKERYEAEKANKNMMFLTKTFLLMAYIEDYGPENLRYNKPNE